MILGLKIGNLENGEFRSEDQWTESQTSVKMQKNKSRGEAQSLEFKEKGKCEGDWKVEAWEAGEAVGKYHETGWQRYKWKM